MALDWLFRIHALSAAAFALPLLFAPAWLAGLLAPEHTSTELSIVFERLYGLSCGLIAVLAWGGSRLPEGPGRRFVAWALCGTECCGILVGWTIPGDGGLALARTLTIAFYVVFAAAYLAILVARPQLAQRPPATAASG